LKQLQGVMRTFGRTCRGRGKVLVGVVRQTEKRLLETGRRVGGLGLLAYLYLEEDQAMEESVRTRLQEQLRQSLQRYDVVQQQSMRLIHGKKLPRAKIVNAYDLSIAPIVKGKSNCPTQFGKKPGLVAEMATGFIFGVHLPVGNPDDASYMRPLLDKVDAAIAKMEHKRKPRVISAAGDRAFGDQGLCQQLHDRGLLTVGIAKTLEPISAHPTPEEVYAVQQQFDLGKIPSAAQVKTAFACGYSRPFVESLIESLSCRGGIHLTYKGHRGALLQITMAILAGNGAALVRIRQGRLTRRAQKFRRFFRLKPPNSLQNNDSKN
jgi:hypothetical protein